MANIAGLRREGKSGKARSVENQCNLPGASPLLPQADFGEASRSILSVRYLNLLVGAPRFELGTPSPPDWCANRAALRSERPRTIEIASCERNQEALHFCRR